MIWMLYMVNSQLDTISDLFSFDFVLCYSSCIVVFICLFLLFQLWMFVIFNKLHNNDNNNVDHLSNNRSKSNNWIWSNQVIHCVLIVANLLFMVFVCWLNTAFLLSPLLHCSQLKCKYHSICRLPLLYSLRYSILIISFCIILIIVILKWINAKRQRV